MSDDDDDTIECRQCGRETPWPAGGSPYCDACMSALASHPCWLAVQRVERGETTVTRGEPAGFMEDYELRTSDGWVVSVFPDGEPFDEWDYIDRMIAPDGTVYAWPDDGQPYTASTLPAYLCLTWSPHGREARDRWQLRRRWLA